MSFCIQSIRHKYSVFGSTFPGRAIKESDIRLKIKKIKSKLACNKIEFALFSCDELLGVKEDLGIAAYKRLHDKLH